MAVLLVGTFTLVNTVGKFVTYRFNYASSWDFNKGVLAREHMSKTSVNSQVASDITENEEVGFMHYGTFDDYVKVNSTRLLYIRPVKGLSYPKHTLGYLIPSNANAIAFQVASLSNGSMNAIGVSTPKATFNIYVDEIVFGVNLTFNNGQNMKSITDGTTQKTAFPATYTVDKDTSFTLNGNDTPRITVQNTQNMKQLQIGSNIYNSFPVSIDIPSNTTIQASGEDDKIITLNTTNTKPPVITNT